MYAYLKVMPLAMLRVPASPEDPFRDFTSLRFRTASGSALVSRMLTRRLPGGPAQHDGDLVRSQLPHAL